MNSAVFVDRNTKNDAEHVALNVTCYLLKQPNFLKETAMDYFSHLKCWKCEVKKLNVQEEVAVSD